jgi:hypothetical protein
MYYFLKHVSELYVHHLVEYLHTLSILLLLSPTLANIYSWGRLDVLFVNVSANYMQNIKILKY